jgi:hypothetical protein
MTKKKIRVRSRRLTDLDESKLSLAVWLLAQDIVEDETDTKLDLPVASEDDGISEDAA